METQLEIIKKFIEETKENFCYIATSESIAKQIPSIAGDSFCLIDLQNDYSPFKPFLTILSTQNPDEKTIRENSFSVQSDSFVSLFKDGIACERYDLPLENEFIYETNRFTKTICTLLKKFNKTNFIVLNSQNLYKSSLQLFSELEKTKLSSKFVFCFNSDCPKSNAPYIVDFLESLNNKINFLFVKENLKEMNLQNCEENGLEEYVANALFDYDSIIKTLRNNRIFMNFDQLKELLPSIAKNIHNFDFTPKQRRLLSLEIALAYYCSGMQDESIFYFNDVIESRIDDDLHTASLHYLSKIFYHKKSNDFAEKYVLQLREKLKDNHESPYYALDAMLDFQFYKRSDVKISTAKYIHALEQLEKHGFTNNFISTGLSIPWELINDIANRPLVDGNIDKCYRLAKEIDNQHLVSKACHWKGIIASHYGEADEAMRWYNECNRIRTEIGETGPIINIRNGLSYESVSRAQYEAAYNLINDTIQKLYTIGDYSSVIDTLKNTGYSLFYGRQFHLADEIFSKILHYLHIFEMENQTNNSFLPSVNDILIFKTIIAFDKKDFIHAKTNYTSIAQNPQDITSEDRPFLFYLRSILYAQDADLDASTKAIENCIQEFQAIKSNQMHKICFVCFEYANVLENFGYKEEAKTYLKRGIQFAEDKKFLYYTQFRNAKSAKEYINSVHQFEPLNLDLAFLTEKAEKEVLFTQLHKRIHDYQFLNKIKTNNVKNVNFNEYLENSLLALFEYTTAESVSICECVKGEYKTIHSISRDQKREFTSEDWQNLFETTKQIDFSQLSYLSKEKLYFGNISQFEYKFGIAIVPSDKTKLTVDNINTLNIAIANIQAQIIIYKQNEYLLFLSSTDQLSLLNNRHALEQHIILESDRIRRFKVRKSTEIQIAVAFIDLDNFKFYNDTFGHGAGDLMITCFAKLLRNTCRQIDFISRFGGDEFVIIMIDTSEKEAICLYNRLKENLEKEEHFIHELEHYMGDKPLNIPENRLLGFSMGISTNFDTAEIEDLETTLQNADKALYHSKETQKGSATLWSSIK